MFGRGRTFDRLDLALKPGRSIAEGTRDLQALLGPGFQIEPPSGRGQHFEAMIASFAVMMGASSLFALFIGMFIIYNAFGVAVTERRSEIAILRALGATRRPDPVAVPGRERGDGYRPGRSWEWRLARSSPAASRCR